MKDLLPFERFAKFPAGDDMTVEEVSKVVGPEFKKMNEEPPPSVKKLKEDMKKADLLPFEEAMYSKGEDVPLSKMPKELQDNVKNPPPAVEKLKKELEESMGADNDLLSFEENCKMAASKGVLDKIKALDKTHIKSVTQKGKEVTVVLEGDTGNSVSKVLTDKILGVLGEDSEVDDSGFYPSGSPSGKKNQLVFKTAASGLYGYTKQTQGDVESAVKKAKKRAADIANAAWDKDDRVASFLQAHVRKNGSVSAKLLLAALEEGGPRVASTERDANEKVARSLYGHPAKTAKLGLAACSEFRLAMGDLAFDLHSRRQDKYAQVTGFLQEHSKKARCAHSKMMLSCYPDDPTPVVEEGKTASSKQEWLVSVRLSRTAGTVESKIVRVAALTEKEAGEKVSHKYTSMGSFKEIDYIKKAEETPDESPKSKDQNKPETWEGKKAGEETPDESPKSKDQNKPETWEGKKAAETDAPNKTEVPDETPKSKDQNKAETWEGKKASAPDSVAGWLEWQE